MPVHDAACRLERVTVSPKMKEELQSLEKSRDGLMVTFRHHYVVWKEMKRKDESQRQPGLAQCLA